MSFLRAEESLLRFSFVGIHHTLKPDKTEDSAHPKDLAVGRNPCNLVVYIMCASLIRYENNNKELYVRNSGGSLCISGNLLF